MATPTATPLHIVENYFDVELDHSVLELFEDVPDEQWIDFAKHYRTVMDARFGEELLPSPERDQDRLGLYFEPRMAHEWSAAVSRLHAPTPLLGLSPDPGEQGEITRRDVSRMISPLAKHLLLADSVYVRDSFYYSFDWIAEAADPMSHPAGMQIFLRRLRGWLPILIELRGLIESRALVFMPGYMTPSFPFGGESSALRSIRRKVRMRSQAAEAAEESGGVDPDQDWSKPPKLPPRDEGADPSGSRAYFNEDDALGAWLNARLLGLDAVFPNRAMFDWAANLYLDEDEDTGDLTSDLISMEILPFGAADGIGLDDLMALRRNEEVFEQVRDAVGSCKHFLEKEISPDSSREGISKACRQHLDERLEDCERSSVLRFIDDNPAAGIGYSLAVGAALVPVNPVIGVAAGALLSPKLARLVQRRFDPKRRAIGRLQALL